MTALPRRPLGAVPVRRPVRRSANFHTAAFRAHRDCRLQDMTYDGDRATCAGCSARWLISRDSRGEPIGYTILPRLHPGLVDA